MNSTTIDQNGSADLQGPSTELNHITDVNPPLSISVQYTDIPTYLHRSEFYLSLDCNQVDEYISVPANCLWSGGAINSTAQFRQYLHTLNFWGMKHFTLEGLEFVFPFHPSSANSDATLEGSAVHWNTMTEVCGADSTLHGALRAVMDQIIPLSIRLNEEDIDPWNIVPPYKLILARDDGVASTKSSLVRILCRSIAKEGRLVDLIALHHQHGDGIWNELTCIRAAQSGNIECVQYLIDNGCACDDETACAAALAGHLHILQFLNNNKLGFDSNTDKWPPRVAEHAARGGYVDCLTFIHENGHPWDEKACWTAGEKGNIKVLQYLHDHGCPWNEDALTWTIKNNNVDAVKFMVERGCPLPADACVVAGSRGDLAMLMYLRECGCPWYDDNYVVRRWTAGQAALHGKLDTLRYAVEHGCPFGNNILIRMFDRSITDTDLLCCIQYLIEDQLQEMDGRLIPLAFRGGYFQCIRYLIDTGCPYTIVQDYSRHLSIQPNVDPDQFYECFVHALERGWSCDALLLRALDRQKHRFARTVEYLQQESLWSDVVANDDDDYD